MLDEKLCDEPARLAALRRYEVLDTPAEEPFDKLTALVKSILKVPICAVSLIDDQRQWFKSRQGLDACQTPRSISFCTHAIRQRDPLVIPNAKTDRRFCENPLVVGSPFIASYAGVPLRSPDGYNIGALCAIDTVARTFEPGQIEILRSFASLVVDELELRQAVRRDFLTGVLSRRAFTNEIERKIALNQRHQRPSALIMFDIDHFKLVNDQHGHAAGDKVLAELAARASSNLRADDCIGRIRGEEFAMLVSETNAEDATKFAERIRLSFATCHIALRTPIKVSASFGISPLTAAITKPDQWLAIADAAMYKAKAQGRNRCVLTKQK